MKTNADLVARIEAQRYQEELEANAVATDGDGEETL